MQFQTVQSIWRGGGWVKKGVKSLNIHIRTMHRVCTIFTKLFTLMKAIKGFFHNHIGKYFMKRPTAKLHVICDKS